MWLCLGETWEVWREPAVVDRAPEGQAKLLNELLVWPCLVRGVRVGWCMHVLEGVVIGPERLQRKGEGVSGERAAVGLRLNVPFGGGGGWAEGRQSRF